MPRLPARLAPVATAFLLTLFMTFIVSGVSTLWALGPTARFLAEWPPAWGLSWLIAFPSALLVMPLVQRIVRRIVAAS